MPGCLTPFLRDNALTTLEAVKMSMGIDPGEDIPQRDAVLVQLINAASAWLETKLGRKLGRQTYTENHMGTGSQRLALEQYPIVSIEAITDMDSGGALGGYDFCDEGNIGVVYREEGWTSRGHTGGLARDYTALRRYLPISYTAGDILPKDATTEEPATLPSDLEAIVWNMVAQQWAIAENDAQGLSAFSISDVSWTFDKNISQMWQDIISLYKRW